MLWSWQTFKIPISLHVFIKEDRKLKFEAFIYNGCFYCHQSQVVALLSLPMPSFFPYATAKAWDRLKAWWQTHQTQFDRDSLYGPIFGWFDIRIADQANSNSNSLTSFGVSYSVPSGVQNQVTILAGTPYVTPDDWEVFYLV